jgi:signal transduction histidine kinase
MKREEILIVEDDILAATIIKKILTQKDYKVVKVVSNSKEALEYVDLSQPDLILMDIFLKDEVDGIETAQQIRNKYDIPIIYLTSDSSDETIQRAKITEPFGYLLKPIDDKTLLTNVSLTLQKQYTYHKKILETLRKVNDELEKKVQERTEELQRINQELKSQIKQRIQAEYELTKSERLATIGKMSAILAHEIRNPLNSIKINADILSQVLELNEGNTRRLQIINKEVNRLDNLVKEVLQFSRQANLLLSEFNLFIFFDNIVNILKPQIEKDEILIINRSENIMISGDNEKLKQVMLNMILNARDAIQGKGEIEISTEMKTGKKVNIYIKDNGSGIMNPEKIFEPFFTTKNSGTGLGLAISQNIIEQHSGKLILVSSKPGETIFCISLPVANSHN